MPMNIKQIKQILNFLSAYPKDVVELGIEAWRTGEMPQGMEGMVTNTPMAQKYSELTPEAQQFIREEAEEMKKIMPFCKCGKQLNLTGVCQGCTKGKEGFKSKFICQCGYEEYFYETVFDKIEQLKGEGEL